MHQKIEKLLHNKEENYIFPFMWLHGEEEAVLRDYMKAIYESNIRAVCVESRPHPDFCGPGWWKDMDIILDEARERNMKIWILDDSHFPTGYANGAVLNAPTERRRQNIFYKEYVVLSQNKVFQINLKKNKSKKKSMKGLAFDIYNKNYHKSCRFDDDKIISVSAAKYNEMGNLEELQDISAFVENDILNWTIPEGKWKVFLCFLSRNTGIHRSYINMMDKESCKILIDAVYEPHYKRYHKDFGTTIAGFFSDEPELGNGIMYQEQNLLGTNQELPWSMELQEQLLKAFGVNWRLKLPLLWNNEFSEGEKAYVRYTYMNQVTRLVEKDFSKQIGDWCEERGVEYIGHIIEDNNQHARTGSSLGHFFRGLSGQHMAGIDNIGGQVIPQGEDLITKNIFGCIRDGEFYHYALAKLGSSYAAIDPKKNGRCMCEIFGNYGWKEGVRLEKYLVDHFMVRGVNHFVPHAFSLKKYPDRDCPPHFYNHGHDPLYRHFGALMQYTNRVCELMSGGNGAEKIAILYHAEAEWVGNYMLMQKPARILAENQIDYNFIPIDVFENIDQYHTNFNDGLNINHKSFKLLIIPYIQFIPLVLEEAIDNLKNCGCTIIFIDNYPDGVIDNGQIIKTDFSAFEKIPLDKLLYKVVDLDLIEVKVQKDAKKVRCYHYINQGDFYFIVNEDNELFSGTISIRQKGKPYEYDAWNNRLYRCEYLENKDWLEFSVTLAPTESMMLVFDKDSVDLVQEPIKIEGTKIRLNAGWKQSICKSIDYPVFTETKVIQELKSLSEEKPRFSGFIRYEKVISNTGYSKIILEITDAYEGVEVFINNISVGIQVVPPYVYDITSLMKEGNNLIKIEVATTLERENCIRRSKLEKAQLTGITGDVNLYVR